MMAKIVCKNHDVTAYTVNGRKHYIVEEKKAEMRSRAADRIVFRTISEVNSFDWATVYNYLDNEMDGLDIYDKQILKAIDRHTI